jgi:hypothetical protein
MSASLVTPAAAALTSADPMRRLQRLQLQLIDGRLEAGQGQATPQDSKFQDAILGLIESLATDDVKTYQPQIEQFLVQLGTPALPFLLKGLIHAATPVRTTCAMALIRLGPDVVPDLIAFHHRHLPHHAHLSWTTGLILEHLQAAI